MDLETRVANLERRVTILEGNTGPVPATPPHIDLDTDATQPLTDWLKTLEPGTVADLQNTAYQVNGSLKLEGLAGLTLNNINIRAEAPSLERDHRGSASSAIGTIYGSQRRHVWLRNCTDITINGLTVRGQNDTDDNGNPIPEDGQAFYHPLLEFEHGIHVEGSTGIHVDGLTVDAVFGDGFYFRGSEDCSIRNFRVSRNGRQGGAFISGSRIKVLHGVIVHSRRSGIDFEPNFAHEVMTDITVEDIDMRTRLLPMTAGGKGTLDGLTIRRIKSHGSSVPVLNLVSPHGGRRDNILVDGWVNSGSLGSPLAAVNASNTDNLTLKNMTITVSERRNMTGARVTNAGRVLMERCWFKGAAQLIDVRDPAPNHELVTTDCAIGIDTPGWWEAPDWV